MKVIRKAVEGVPGLIESKYIKGNGGVSVRYFARIKEKGRDRQPLFAFGSDFGTGDRSADRDQNRAASRRGFEQVQAAKENRQGKGRADPGGDDVSAVRGNLSRQTAGAGAREPSARLRLRETLERVLWRPAFERRH